MVILVVDDEPRVRRALDRALRHNGYDVHQAADGSGVLELVEQLRPSLIVLDVLMPRLDGLEVCRRLRARGDRRPVLLLTARDAVGDRVAGLDAGADDYLVKPFALPELLARIRALLRRGEAPGGGPRLAHGQVSLDPQSRTGTVRGRTVALTSTETTLLEVLLRHPGLVLTRKQLYEAVWGADLRASSNSLDVYVGYLRRKLEAEGGPRLLRTVRGVGYVLEPAAEQAES